MEMCTSAATSLSLPTPTTTTPLNTKIPESNPNPIDQAPTTTIATRIQPTKPISFTNGVLKRQPHPPSSNLTLNHKPQTTYKECLKNHAASIGGHALDGCGEFMPSPDSVSSDPTSLKCAACGCHRNFHRREPEDSLLTTTAATTTSHVMEYHPHHRHHPPPPPPPPLSAPPPQQRRGRSPSSQSPPPISSSYYPASAPHMLLALSGGNEGGVHHHHPHHHHNSAGTYSQNQNPGLNNSGPGKGRKRFRTKFSQDQKDRMFEFAEKVGWKLQKNNEEMVADFCNEVGVERGVFKVWMHNNKNTYGKRDLSGNNNIDSAVRGGGGIYPHQINNDENDGGGESRKNNVNDGNKNNKIKGSSSSSQLFGHACSKNGVITSSGGQHGGGSGTNGSSSSS